ncbi:hypothetical protein M7784_03940 [Desulfovibrio aminophilus]|nr:hypothetical protein [Desulfovibrio aminophilus]MCM0754394.1 hypothetical protein [Desulfovibrio aminophilus]
MIVVASGEGPTDIGICNAFRNYCAGDLLALGPFALLIDDIVEAEIFYSPIDNESFYVVSRSYLSQKWKQKKRGSIRFPGFKSQKGSVYFEYNARALSIVATEIVESLTSQGEAPPRVIAILYRDSDGSNSSPKGEWQTKYDSIVRGFAQEKFPHGVAMLAKPIGESWLISGCLQLNASQAIALEARSPNSKAAVPLKGQLENEIEARYPHHTMSSTESMVALINDQHVTLSNILTPSFMKFLTDLRAVLATI